MRHGNNLSHWPPAKIEALRRVLRDEAVVAPEQAVTLLRSLPHGHVAAALGTLRRIGLDRVLSGGGRQPKRAVALCTGMLVARLISPASKLATARQLDGTTASCSLGPILVLDRVEEEELYAALDWLIGQQPRIEKALARRHLCGGTLVLYDVSSTYFEGRSCPLARFGHSRDGKLNKLQIVFGLLCAVDGCPIAVEVFEGNVGDPKTLAAQIAKIKNRFGLKRVVLVGDRGLITSARIAEELRPGSTGSPRSGRRPSGRSPPPAACCSCRCWARPASRTTSAIWPRSKARTIRASASSSAATRRWPRSARASGPNCSMPPRTGCVASRPGSAGRAGRCGAPTRSASPSALSSTAARWPSTSPSSSPTTT
jgi:hypothetical protein